MVYFHCTLSPALGRTQVRAGQLIANGVNADVRKYLLLLHASAADLLNSAGYTTKSVNDSVRGYTLKRLDDF